jgi:hypothetical protein
MRARKTKRPVGRPPGRIAEHRPVLAARVPQAFYDVVSKAARSSGRTISEELVFQAQLALNIGDAQKFLSEIDHVTKEMLPAKMRQFGLKPIHSAFGTYWKEEEMPPLKGRLDPEIKAAIIEAVREALKNEKE